MSERSFTHLHTHTEFSMLDGAARIGALVAAAAADGQPALRANGIFKITSTTSTKAGDFTLNDLFDFKKDE